MEAKRDDEARLVRTAAAVLLAAGVVLSPGCKRKSPPEIPAVPSGPSSGAVGVKYSFSSSAEDSAGEDVAIRFDWGDGDTSNWSGWVRPGETVTMNHAWSSLGSFNVKAQAKARNSASSEWSEALTFAVLRTFARTFGGTGDDWGNSVQQTRDGGYVVVGTTSSYGAGGLDAWLIKVNIDGNEVWDRTFGGTGNDQGNSVEQTQDGGYIIAGSTHGDAWLIKTDSAGNRAWDRVYGGSGSDGAASVRQTRNGGYIICGTTWSYGAGLSDIWLIKTASNGDTVWTRTFGGGEWEYGNSVQQTADGGYVVAGRGYFRSRYYGIQLVLVDSMGNEVWYRTFDSEGRDGARSVRQTQYGDFIVAGYIGSWGAGYRDAWVLKVSNSGSGIWTRICGGAFDDEYGSVYQTQDGGYVLAGSYDGGTGYRDLWLVRTDANGDTIWTRTFGGASEDDGCSVQQTEDGGFIVAGLTCSFSAGERDIWLIKTDAEGIVGEGQDGFGMWEPNAEARNDRGR